MYNPVIRLGALFAVLSVLCPLGSFASSRWLVDVTGDGVPDEIVGQPDTGAGLPGAVFIKCGTTGAILFELRGSAPDDRFGEAVAVAESTISGYFDLIVGAPGSNEIFVIPIGDVAEVCTMAGATIDASDASRHHFSLADDTLFDVGYEVAPGHSFNKFMSKTFRFAARFAMDDGSIGTQEFIIDSRTGLFVARIHRYIQSDGLERLEGDAIGDGEVHMGDIDLVLENLGAEGEGIAGDLNLDLGSV